MQINLVTLTEFGHTVSLGHCITTSVSKEAITDFLIALRHRAGQWQNPQAIVSDGAAAIEGAVAAAHCSVPHYLCLWHLNKTM